MADNPERTFRKVTPTLVSWKEPGLVLEGTLRSKGTMEFDGNEVGRYTLEDNDLSLVGFLGGTILDEALKEVDTGAYIRVTYRELAETRAGQPVKLFEVEVAE